MMGQFITSRIPVIVPIEYDMDKTPTSTLYVLESICGTLISSFRLHSTEFFYLHDMCEKNHNRNYRITGVHKVKFADRRFVLEPVTQFSNGLPDGFTRSLTLGRANNSRRFGLAPER
jgi:hypothetical protein